MIANFWRSPGIVTLFDPDANILAQKEMIPGSTHLAAGELARRRAGVRAAVSANVREGGMVDGQLRRVVMFPDDGHPDLAYHVLNVTGDARDEIIVWDQQRVWIYTQDRPFTGTRICSQAKSGLQRFQLPGHCVAARLEMIMSVRP